MGVASQRDQEFGLNPAQYFDMSETRMHSMPRDELTELQLRLLRTRVEENRERIPMLAKLAKKQGITSVDDFDAALPLFFDHYVYKSYPPSLLSSGRFDVLTRFVDKLSTKDLSSVNTAGCRSIDEWLDELSSQAHLIPVTSSGTTGTMSFVPKTQADWDVFGETARISILQDFGSPPGPEDTDEPVHGIWPTFADGYMTPFQCGKYFLKHMSRGKPGYSHPALPGRGSADVMYLAGRMAAAEARGESPKVAIPGGLQGRIGELKKLKADTAKAKATYLVELTTNLAGARVAGLSAWTFFHELATMAAEIGVKCQFAPRSCIVSGGGGKGVVVPDNWQQFIEDFFGLPLRMAYSMSETVTLQTACDKGRIHLKPWVIPYVLDPDTSKPLPRSGVRKGRAAFFDLCASGFWGGVISGDEIEIDWSEICPCGRLTPHISLKIQRFSEKQGGNDKITCTATAAAHADAMDYLTTLS